MVGSFLSSKIGVKEAFQRIGLQTGDYRRLILAKVPLQIWLDRGLYLGMFSL